MATSNSSPAPTVPNYEIPTPVQTVLSNLKAQGKKVVVMTCGISGSGKSTLARALESQSFYVRLSIDKIVYETYGVYDVDYPVSQYSQLQESAEDSLISSLKTLLQAGEKDIVLDLSFYSHSFRSEYRSLISIYGHDQYVPLLVVFKVPGSLEEQEWVLWGRIEGRRREMEERLTLMGKEGGGEGMSPSRRVLGEFVRGFEWPVEEEEEVGVDVI